MDIPFTLKVYNEKSLSYYGDGITKQFFERLKSKEFSTVRCKECGKILLPPKPFCDMCYGSNLEWVQLPSRGSLYAFTQQGKAFRFSTPDVIGIVEFDNKCRILTRINGRYEDLKIGMQVELEFLELEQGVVLHQFKLVNK